MSRFAGNHLLVPVLSRLIPRGARVRCGAVSAGLRALALLAAAPILFGLTASALTCRGDAAAVQVAPAVVSLPALHVVQAYRLAFEAHARTHAPIDAAPPTCDSIGALVAFSRCGLAISAFAQPGDAVVTRGYDATAPPALS